VLALISGGGSALLIHPADGIALAEKQALTQALLASGAPIGEINGIRKEISAVKGGRLAVAAHPARMLALLISDVPGDNPGDIASGPTVGPFRRCGPGACRAASMGCHPAALDPGFPRGRG
jgi:glycerate 2-kinase